MNLLSLKNIFSADFLEKHGLVFILILFVGLSTVGIFYNYPLPNTVADETVLMDIFSDKNSVPKCSGNAG